MKLVREYIYEKFTEVSDPIRDMGIGMRSLIDQWYKETYHRKRIMNWNRESDINSMLSIVAATGRTDFIDYLLTIGADIHHNGEVALRNAAVMNHIDTVTHLIKRGANVDKAINNAISESTKIMLTKAKKLCRTK
jgi:hypothetical protein